MHPSKPKHHLSSAATVNRPASLQRASVSASLCSCFTDCGHPNPDCVTLTRLLICSFLFWLSSAAVSFGSELICLISCLRWLSGFLLVFDYRVLKKTIQGKPLSEQLLHWQEKWFLCVWSDVYLTVFPQISYKCLVIYVDLCCCVQGQG